MSEHLFSFISSIVAGIVTNGIQEVSHCIISQLFVNSRLVRCLRE